MVNDLMVIKHRCRGYMAMIWTLNGRIVDNFMCTV